MNKQVDLPKRKLKQIDGWMAIVISLLIGFLVMIGVTFGFSNQKHAQETRFLQLQEVLLNNQVTMRDSLLASTKAEVDTLREQLLLYNPETLWLARGIYSETNDPVEMYPVGWVIRNRVDLNYHGCKTFKCVILDPLQFSAFNWNSRSKLYYQTKSITDEGQVWTTALAVAAEIIEADSSSRPFSIYTTNYYSPVSMNPQYSTPSWVTSELTQVNVENINPSRFRFYEIQPELLTRINYGE